MQSSIANSGSKSGRFAALLGLGALLSAAAVGCVVTVGSGGKTASECPDPNSKLDNNECFCTFDYEWCNPNDDSDLTCCKKPDATTNVSATNNDTGGTGTGTDTGGTGTATGGTSGDVPTTGEPLDCSASASVPESCDPNTENFLCVTADNPDCGPEGSKYYVCDGGTWAQDPTGPTGQCTSEGYDFAYGCEDKDNMVQFVCGNGPGTACSGNGKSCNGDTNLEFCEYGKLGAVDCLKECMENGDGGGVTYDFGYCGPQGGSDECICCDEGEPDCPLGGGTSGGSTGGGSSTTG